MSGTDRLKPFQENARRRLGEILRCSSRAFLADEAGLGKTFVSTAVMVDRARSQWSLQGETPTPFFALYVCPNTALLEKNCQDIRKKAQSLLRNDETFQMAYETADFLGILSQTLDRKDGTGSLTLQQREEFLNRAKECMEKSRPGTSFWQKEGTRQAYEEKKPLNIKFDTFWTAVKEFKEDSGQSVDRLAFLDFRRWSGKTIVLVPTSIHLMGRCGPGSEEERRALGMPPEKSSEEEVNERRIEAEQDKLRRFGLVMLDEYHRYTGDYDEATDSFKTLSEHAEAIFRREQEQALRILFISATPYRSNLSGLEEHYGSTEDMDPDSEGKRGLQQLPGFRSFARLFTLGRTTDQDLCAAEDLNQLNDRFMLTGSAEDGEALQEALSHRMVRNTRTQLSMGQEPEKHQELFSGSLLNEEGSLACGPQLRQMRRQVQALKAPAEWAENMPWLMSFASRYGGALLLDQNGKLDSNLFDGLKQSAVLEGEEKYLHSPEQLDSLPQQNVAFWQMCSHQVTEELAQLIWLPPTAPVYTVKDSIFTRYRNHTKLLVFGEYLYMQRGGSLLLSQYALRLNRTEYGAVQPEFCLSWSDQAEELAKQELPKGDLGLSGLSAEDMAAIAAPAVCAIRLGLGRAEARRVENSFNRYFNRPGVKDALIKWIVARKLPHDSQEEWNLGLLRYCVEGCLFAVLSEWFYTQRVDGATLDGLLADCLTRTPCQTHVLGQKSMDAWKRRKEELTPEGKQELWHAAGGTEMSCPFAERLTYDKMDNGASGTGSGESGHRGTIRAFNSPFWPMVLFVGRGAQEGLDFHLYCQRIMHFTLPLGPVSFDQRQGRIDRYGSLLVRRRAVELASRLGLELSPDDSDFFSCLMEQLKACPDLEVEHREDALFPEWQIRETEGFTSEHHFQRLVPAVEFTEGFRRYEKMRSALEAYRLSYGAGAGGADGRYVVDLTTK